MSEGRNTELVSELREAAKPIPKGACGVLPPRSLYARAADALESTSRALREKEGELAEANGEVEALRSAIGSGGRLRETMAECLREADAKIDACTPYLKDGETPRERMDRDFKESQALTGLLAEARSQRDEALAALKASEERLADPIAVHINMMRGTIAKPSLENIHHLYPEIRENAARMRLALRQCQSTLAMMTAPDAIKQTTVVNAYANAVAAEAMARSALENGPAELADATKKDPGTEQREAGV